MLARALARFVAPEPARWFAFGRGAQAPVRRRRDRAAARRRLRRRDHRPSLRRSCRPRCAHPRAGTFGDRRRGFRTRRGAVADRRHRAGHEAFLHRAVPHRRSCDPDAADRQPYRRCSDATSDLARQQEHYEIGSLDWTIVDASGTPDETLAREAMRRSPSPDPRPWTSRHLTRAPASIASGPPAPRAAIHRGHDLRGSVQRRCARLMDDIAARHDATARATPTRCTRPVSR